MKDFSNPPFDCSQCNSQAQAYHAVFHAPTWNTTMMAAKHATSSNYFIRFNNLPLVDGPHEPLILHRQMVCRAICIAQNMRRVMYVGVSIQNFYKSSLNYAISEIRFMYR